MCECVCVYVCGTDECDLNTTSHFQRVRFYREAIILTSSMMVKQQVKTLNKISIDTKKGIERKREKEGERETRRAKKERLEEEEE